MRSSYGHRVHDKPKEKKHIVIEKKNNNKNKNKKKANCIL